MGILTLRHPAWDLAAQNSRVQIETDRITGLTVNSFSEAGLPASVATVHLGNASVEAPTPVPMLLKQVLQAVGSERGETIPVSFRGAVKFKLPLAECARFEWT